MADNQKMNDYEEVNAPEAETEEIAVSSSDAASAAVAVPPKESGKFVAGFKEWLRKFIVKLKRKTQMIPLVLTLITSFVYLCMIGTFSQLIQLNSGIPSVGICMFVTTLASILILPLFLNAFPKNKKPVIAFIVSVFVVYALLIAMDLVFFINLGNFAKGFEGGSSAIKFYDQARSSLIVHIVMVGICLVAFALLPLYKAAINKINTKKVVLSNDFSGEIDTSEEES